jgi:hypothetical protein
VMSGTTVKTWLARVRTWLRARLRTGLRTTMQTMREQRKTRTAMTERPPVVQMIPLWMDGRHDGV